MEEGRRPWHAAVVARPMDIPVVAQVNGALSRIDAFDQIVLDANAGQVILRPAMNLWIFIRAPSEACAQQVAGYAAVRNLRQVTKDGEISLYLNAGILLDMQNLV